jgi:tRNA-specific 2-thiouridylase
VAVAMSGGIDSSVVALLLQKQGFNCIGIMMKNWDFSDEAGTETCPYTEDKKDMQSVCERLRIPSYEVRSIVPQSIPIIAARITD